MSIAHGDLYELAGIPRDSIINLQASFARLPQDPYADENLRSRRYSRFRLRDGKTLELLSHKDFMQSSSINSYVGDVERRYEDIEDSTIKDPGFIRMFQEFLRRTSLHPDSVIEAHQIRWHCRRNIKLPAPEGTHQDGFDYIAMFMVDSKNIDGGEIMIYPSKDDPPMFKKKLEPGEFVILNDKELLHNATPLVPVVNSPGGHWDLIVLTAHNAAGESTEAA